MVRSSWGAPSYNPASRFLAEVPESLVDWRRVESSRGTPQIAVAAARPTAKSPGTRSIITLQVGDKVTHNAFGLGTVVATAGVADKSEATIDFGSAGTKRLLLRYAPVEKL
jgi:DNA helicase-2/ATP-dependent DNA helicase PcrA